MFDSQPLTYVNNLPVKLPGGKVPLTTENQQTFISHEKDPNALRPDRSWKPECIRPTRHHELEPDDGQ
ncbi:hypothetical protein GCM10027275_18560 [Rhabdobacter roseus]